MKQKRIEVSLSEYVRTMMILQRKSLLQILRDSQLSGPTVRKLIHHPDADKQTYHKKTVRQILEALGDKHRVAQYNLYRKTGKVQLPEGVTVTLDKRNISDEEYASEMARIDRLVLLYETTGRTEEEEEETEPVSYPIIHSKTNAQDNEAFLNKSLLALRILDERSDELDHQFDTFQAFMIDFMVLEAPNLKFEDFQEQIDVLFSYLDKERNRVRERLATPVGIYTLTHSEDPTQVITFDAREILSNEAHSVERLTFALRVGRDELIDRCKGIEGYFAITLLDQTWFIKKVDDTLTVIELH